MIFSVRTVIGQEKVVVESIAYRAKEENLEVYSLGILPNLKGYILIEAKDELTARLAVHDAPYIKAPGVLKGVISLKELAPVLEQKGIVAEIKEGMKVEVISGPFKGEKAKVLRYNEAKEEVTVEMLDAAVKIPLTIKADSIKILRE